MIYSLKYLLDTNACINYLNFPNSLIWEKIKSTPAFEIAVCSVVKAELFYGAKKSKNPNDLQIAAIALANDLTLITHNTSEFSRIANLKIEDWEI